MRNEIGRPTLPDLQIYYKAIIIKTMRLRCWQKDRYTDEGDNRETDPHEGSQPIFDIRAKAS